MNGKSRQIMANPNQSKNLAKSAPSSLSRYITEFLEYCEIGKNQSPQTLRNYNHYLRRFAEFSAQSGTTDPKNISLEH